MTKLLLLPILTIAFGYFITHTKLKFERTESPSAQIGSRNDTSEFDQEEALAMLREEIKEKKISLLQKCVPPVTGGRLNRH